MGTKQRDGHSAALRGQADRSDTHTPGPWHLDTTRTNGHCGWTVSGINGQIATVYADIVEAPRPPRSIILEQNAPSLANARLIAAAPELLQALINITAGLDDSRDTMPLIKGREVKQARAAIERATAKG